LSEDVNVNDAADVGTPVHVLPGWCREWSHQNTRESIRIRGVQTYFTGSTLTQDTCIDHCNNDPQCHQAVYEASGPWGPGCWLGNRTSTVRPTSSRRGCVTNHPITPCVDHCYNKAGWARTAADPPAATVAPTTPAPICTATVDNEHPANWNAARNDDDVCSLATDAASCRSSCHSRCEQDVTCTGGYTYHVGGSRQCRLFGVDGSTANAREGTSGPLSPSLESQMFDCHDRPSVNLCTATVDNEHPANWNAARNDDVVCSLATDAASCRSSCHSRCEQDVTCTGGYTYHVGGSRQCRLFGVDGSTANAREGTSGPLSPSLESQMFDCHDRPSV